MAGGCLALSTAVFLGVIAGQRYWPNDDQRQKVCAESKLCGEAGSVMWTGLARRPALLCRMTSQHATETSARSPGGCEHRGMLLPNGLLQLSKRSTSCCASRKQLGDESIL